MSASLRTLPDHPADPAPANRYSFAGNHRLPPALPSHCKRRVLRGGLPQDLLREPGAALGGPGALPGVFTTGEAAPQGYGTQGRTPYQTLLDGLEVRRAEEVKSEAAKARIGSHRSRPVSAHLQLNTASGNHSTAQWGNNHGVQFPRTGLLASVKVRDQVSHPLRRVQRILSECPVTQEKSGNSPELFSNLA